MPPIAVFMILTTIFMAIIEHRRGQQRAVRRSYVEKEKKKCVSMPLKSGAPWRHVACSSSPKDESFSDCANPSKQRALMSRDGRISYRGVHFNDGKGMVGGGECS